MSPDFKYKFSILFPLVFNYILCIASLVIFFKVIQGDIGNLENWRVIAASIGAFCFFGLTLLYTYKVWPRIKNAFA